MSDLDQARAVADAVLYEGYVLYPYRASSSKNQVRFQWGVLMPDDVVERDPSERAANRTEVVVEGKAPRLEVRVRYLHVQRRAVQARTDDGWADVDTLELGDTRHAAWDEATEREHALTVDLAPEGTHEQEFEVPGGAETETLTDADGSIVGRLVRTRLPLRTRVRVHSRRPASPYGVTMVAVEVENAAGRTAAGGDTRTQWLRRALVAAHTLLAVDGGRFVSLLDPPEWAKGYVGACQHEGTFPVLMGTPGEQHVMLSSPIILYDHPQLAPESESAFFDALEIDELLSLRTLTLSEAEKREVRGTDPRTAELLDQVEGISPDLWDRLHGTVRYLDTMTGAPEPTAGPDPATPTPETPWWDPGSDASVDPEHDTVRVGAVDVGRGSRVVLRPGARRADAFDMFLAGLEATVAAVLQDVDGAVHLAVTVDDDPGQDLKLAHGRFLYFAPDEVEPLRSQAGSPP